MIPRYTLPDMGRLWSDETRLSVMLQVELLVLEAQAKQELGPMRRYLGVLDTMITLAPLLGIYGTITGMIRAFGFLSRAGLPDPQLVAAGIAEALITTAAGLTVAILAIPPYNFFAAKTEEIAHEIERSATALELLANQREEARVP